MRRREERRSGRASGVLAAFLALVFAWMAMPGLAATGSPPAGVLTATLDNGLRVVIVANALAPVVTTVVNYRVGADETPPGFPGTAHALEHMMFRGSAGLSADQLANIGSLMGGNFNAETRQTVTQYLFTIPAEDLDVALQIEALRMRNVAVTRKDWEQERGAIEQEVAQDLSSPLYVLSSRLRASLFKSTSYAHDALGTRASFQRTTAAMLRDFHDRWYAPNNALLVIAGNVDPASTLAKVKALFGSIAAKTLPQRPAVKLPPVKVRSFSLKTDLPYTLQVTALRMPGLDSPDYAAAQVLADVLNSQRGALYELVPRGKALSAGFSFEPLAKAGLGYATLTIAAGGNARAIEREVRAILTRIATEGVPAELVASAKLQERREAQFQKNSIEGLAMAWSEAVAVNGLNSPDEDLARIEQVSVEDVNRVARTYLDLRHAVFAVLKPRGAGKALAAGGFSGQESLARGETNPTLLPDWAQATLGRLSVPASGQRPVVSRLANGITLIVQPEDASETVSVYGHIKNRPELQLPAGKEGLDQVLDQLFSYGSEGNDRLAFRRALDEIGADEQAGADFQLRVLKEHFERGVELLADNELHPGLPAAAFETVRRQVAQSVAGQLKSPGYLSGRALRMALFPKDDPSLREALPRTVSGITLDDVRSYYRAAFRPDLTAIVVVGNVAPGAARAVIEKYFGNWNAAGPEPETSLPPVPPNARSSTAVPDASRVQEEVTLAETIGITRASPDYYALKLGNTVLGGGFYSTRLSRDLRKSAGLVYSIESELDVGKRRSVHYVTYACDPRNVTKVHASVVRELDDMQKTPVTADELQRAKAMLLRQIPLGEASTDAIAHGFMERWSLDLPLDEPRVAARHYIDLSADDVRRAFAKWLRPGALVRVTQGPSAR